MTTLDSVSDCAWQDYVVHLPTPDAFGAELAASKAALLHDVRYLLVVGSLLRPRRIAEHAAALGLRHVGTYFNMVEESHVGDREFNVEVVALDTPEPVHVAVASHGIGVSGVEIVLGEMLALVQLARQRAGLPTPSRLLGVGRSGTRGTLGPYDYGTVGISTASFDDDFAVALPDPALLAHTVAAAQASGHPHALGAGISTRFFWSGQGRLLPTQRPLAAHTREQRERGAQELLWRWLERGIEFVEMEDVAVHRIGRELGIPSVSVGAIVARRYDAAGERFVLDYDGAAKERSELWPAEILLAAFARHWHAAGASA